MWLDFKVRLLTLSLQGTEAAQGWIRGGYIHIGTHRHRNKQTMRTLSMGYLVKMKVVKRGLENNKLKLEEMSAMNNFNSKLHFFFMKPLLINWTFF